MPVPWPWDYSFLLCHLLIMVITGLTIPMFTTPATVLLQERVGEDYLGRVFGIPNDFKYYDALGMLVFGPLADIVVIEWLLIGTGLLLFIPTFSSWATSRCWKRKTSF